MPRLFPALLTLVVALVAPLAPSTQDGGVALRFGRLWTGSATIAPAVVIVRNGRIAAVGGAATAIPDGMRVVDLGRYTGLPGLIDLHTHMTYYWDRQPGTRPLGQRRNPSVTVFLAQDNARATLETGVTTARDLGASNDTDLAMRDLINMGRMVGPRMLVSGQGISARRGGQAGPEAMAALTKERLQTPADWIKVYGSRGSFQSVDTTQTISFEEMKAIVDTAHAAGRKVAIHSYGPTGVRDAALAGADSIEHGIDLDDDTLREMARRGTVWVPTVDHNRFYVDAKDDFGFAPETIPPLEAYIQKNFESVARAFRAGVKVGMGSDAVYSGFGQNTRELGWFVKAGMTPEQALATATTTAADLLGLGDRLGRVAPGFLADLVAVAGNPLENINALFTGVRWVMKDGRIVVDR